MGESSKIRPMKIVLLDNIRGVGRKFEVKNVAGGYARNHLLPHGLALLANQLTLKQIESLKKQAEQRRTRLKDKAAELIGQLDEKTVTLEARANEQGHLFQGLDRSAVAEAIKQESKIEIEPDWLELERPLKALGDYDLKIVSGPIEGKIKITIKPQKLP